MAGGAVVLTGTAYLWIQRDGNVHTVQPGLVYRSAQLSGPDLQRLIASHGVKTVLNLRGENTGTPWYDDEIRTTRAEGAVHLDYRMSAYRVLSDQQMVGLLKLVKDSPKPILIHCESGSGRTGLVSALYRYTQGNSLLTARDELSLKYGHFRYFLSRSVAMDQSLDLYAKHHPAH